MYSIELCLHVLIILLSASSTNELATLLLKTTPDTITLLTPNDMRFLVVLFRLRINSSTASDRFLCCRRSFYFVGDRKMATSKLPSSNVGVTWYGNSFKTAPGKFPILALPVFNSLLRSVTRILRVILLPKITIRFCVCPAKDLLIYLAVPA